MPKEKKAFDEKEAKKWLRTLTKEAKARGVSGCYFFLEHPDGTHYLAGGWASELTLGRMAAIIIEKISGIRIIAMMKNTPPSGDRKEFLSREIAEA